MKTLGIAALCGLSIAATATMAPAQSRNVLKPADVNGDGRVSLSEYQVSRRDFVMRADTSHDGQVSRKEWEVYARSVRKELELDGVTGAEKVGSGVWWRELDANADGVVTGAELDAMTARRFALYDADHDGFIQRAEAQQVVKRSQSASR